MKRQHRFFSPLLYYGVMGLFTGIIVLYIWYACNSFRAFDLSRSFLQTASLSSYANVPDVLEAIRIAPRHPRYPYILANAFYNEQQFDEAEQWLRKAILLDPANHLSYYLLGRISHDRGDCLSGDCFAARYFLMALHNYPKSPFLRAQVCSWYYDFYDRTTAIHLMRDILSRDEGTLIVDERTYFAEFLYKMRLDDEHDLELERVSTAEPQQFPVAYIGGESSGVTVVELGNDDGGAEWKTSLASLDQRVKKRLSLPENLIAYRSAALKVLMSRTGKAPLSVKVSLNSHPIPIVEQLISHVPEWHELPIDLTLLHGHSTINVYIRAQTSASDTSLEIWGDRDTPTTQRVYHSQQTEDLSSDEGRQSGEYMIRLILRK